MDVEEIKNKLSDFHYQYDMGGVQKIEINIAPKIKIKTFSFQVNTRSKCGVLLSPTPAFKYDEYLNFIAMLREENLKIFNIKTSKTKSYIEVCYGSLTGNINFKRSVASKGACELSVDLDKDTLADITDPALRSLEDFVDKLAACKK